MFTKQLQLRRVTALRFCCSVTSSQWTDEGQSHSAVLANSDSGPVKGTSRERKKSLCLPTVFLPSTLQAANERALKGYSRKFLRADGEALSHFLLSRKMLTKQKTESRRAVDQLLPATSPWKDERKSKSQHSLQHFFRYGRREAVAFAASRLPAVYGTILRVLTEVARRDKSFRPETLLDFGSGLGTTVWAARQLWAESLYEYQCIDVSAEMGDLAAALRNGGEIPSQDPHLPHVNTIPGVYFRQYLPLSNKVQYDMVVCAHSLGEMSSVKVRRMTLAALWRKTKQYLVLVEPGTWTGFNLVAEAREMILEANSKWTRYEDESGEDLEGHVFAPCPHDQECPLTMTDSKAPCYFGQRVQLSLSERSGPLKYKGYHLENFSYVVLKKGSRVTEEGPAARVLQPVRKRSRHVLCKLCTSQGKVCDVILTKSKHQPLYRECRECKWGDTLFSIDALKRQKSAEHPIAVTRTHQ